jgi:hypothetical protein
MHKESTYTIGDFIMLSPPQFLVMPEIQQRVRFPFTVENAARFFEHFTKVPFKFEGVIQSVVIYDGRENLPNHSYAAGWLYEQSLEQLSQLEDSPEPIGSLYFEYGGTTTAAIIRVEVAENESD